MSQNDLTIKRANVPSKPRTDIFLYPRIGQGKSPYTYSAKHSRLVQPEARSFMSVMHNRLTLRHAYRPDVMLHNGLHSPYQLLALTTAGMDFGPVVRGHLASGHAPCVPIQRKKTMQNVQRSN